MEYFRKIELDHTKPWLIVGKGPSFKRIHSLKKDYNIFGLNHVAELIKCDITHFIDIDVITSRILVNSKNIICPWHLHENNKVQFKTLEYHTRKPGYYACIGKKLHWYNCSTWKSSHYILSQEMKKEIIKVRYFSAEAAFQLLGFLGIKKVYSVGIDGGCLYDKAFFNLGLMPFTNRRQTFDDQFKMIEETLTQFDMEWEKL